MEVEVTKELDLKQGKSSVKLDKVNQALSLIWFRGWCN